MCYDFQLHNINYYDERVNTDLHETEDIEGTFLFMQEQPWAGDL